MVRKVISTVKKYELLKRGDKIVIALSGGADSVFLLYALNKIKKLYSLEFYIAHLNHQLRKKADEDAEFVKEIAERCVIQCIVAKRDVRNYAKEKKLSLEEGARELRYEFLEEVASKVRASKIAMGHTITDEAETLIFRLIRGTGLKGLALIPPKRGKIIRPLIEIEHNEILDFLKSNGIAYRKDYSNYRTKRTRNFIRYKIMPQITMQASDFSKKSMRLRDIVEAEDGFLERITNEKLKSLKVEKSIGIFLQGFLKEDLAIKRRIIRKMGGKQNCPFSFEETENILKFISRGKIQSPKSKNQINFKIHAYQSAGRQNPNIICVKIQNGIISFELSNEPNAINEPNEINEPITFPVPGEIQVGELKLRAQICNNVQLNTATKDKVYFDFDKLALPLFIRKRENGDVFRGDGYNKKLKELFIDDKVPREVRDFIPLLADQNGILWVVKHRRSSKALVDGKTKRVLEIEAM